MAQVPSQSLPRPLTSNTKTWWERRPDADVQLWGTGSDYYMRLLAGGSLELRAQAAIGIQTNAPNSVWFNVNVTGGSTPTEAFHVFDQYTNRVNFKVKSNGKTMIGEKTLTGGNYTGAMLTVDVTIANKETVVTMQNWSDFVFDKGYRFPSLSDVEKYYQRHGHLENIPSGD
jgi:hypothetical protein